jgi:hypothetical protein
VAKGLNLLLVDTKQLDHQLRQEIIVDNLKEFLLVP